MTTDPTPPTDHDAATLTNVRVIGEALCPPSHREGWVTHIVGKSPVFGPRTVCTLHAVQARTVAAALAARDAVPATAQGPGVAAVLAEHRFQSTTSVDGTRDYGWCGCGKSYGTKHISEHEAHVAAALAAAGQPTTQPAPEATTVTEWGLQTGREPIKSVLRVAWEVAEASPWSVDRFTRTRTAYADHVTDWVPVVSEESSRG